MILKMMIFLIIKKLLMILKIITLIIKNYLDIFRPFLKNIYVKKNEKN